MQPTAHSRFGEEAAPGGSMHVGVRRSSLLRKALAAVASISSIAFVPPAAIAKRHPACTEAIARCKVTECASLSDDERGACEQVCDAQCSGPRTLAYVVTECCQAPGNPPTVTQALKIRRQNRATETV